MAMWLSEKVRCYNENCALRHVIVAEVSIIIPVKDEEEGLRYLIDDLASSGLRELYSTEFIFVIDEELAMTQER